MADDNSTQQTPAVTPAAPAPTPVPTPDDSSPVTRFFKPLATYVWGALQNRAGAQQTAGPKLPADIARMPEGPEKRAAQADYDQYVADSSRHKFLNAVVGDPVKAEQLVKEDAQRREEGYGHIYRAAAGLAEATGLANPTAMEQKAAKGDTAGVLGETAGPLAMATAGPIAEGATGAIHEAGAAARENMAARREASLQEARSGKVVDMPGAAKELPEAPKAIPPAPEPEVTAPEGRETTPVTPAGAIATEKANAPTAQKANAPAATPETATPEAAKGEVPSHITFDQIGGKEVQAPEKPAAGFLSRVRDSLLGPPKWYKEGSDVAQRFHDWINEPFDHTEDIVNRPPTGEKFPWENEPAQSAEPFDYEREGATVPERMARNASPEMVKRVQDAPMTDDPQTGYRVLNIPGVGQLQYSGWPGDENSRVRASRIDPAVRNQGVGKEFYKKAIEDARARGIKTFMSDTMVSPDAQHAWDSLMREGKYPIQKIYTGNRLPSGHGGVEYHVDLTPGAEPTTEQMPQPEHEQTLARRGQMPGQTVNLSDAYGETGGYVGGHVAYRVPKAEQTARAIANLGVTQGPELQEIPPELLGGVGDAHSTGTHELAHAVRAAQVGLPTEGVEVQSPLHPDVRLGDAANTVFDWSPIPGVERNSRGDLWFPKEILEQTWPKFLSTYVAGAVGEELGHGIPLHENVGKSGDFEALHNIGQIMGFSQEQVQDMIDAEIPKTREALRPVMHHIIEAAGTRESGLSRTLLHSAEKVKDLIRKTKEVPYAEAEREHQAVGEQAGGVVPETQARRAGVSKEGDVREGNGEAVSPIAEVRKSPEQNLTLPPKDRIWFGKSRVTDDSGAPLKVYHGASPARPLDRPIKNDRYTTGRFFSSSPDVAGAYGPDVIPAILKMENPFIVDAQGHTYSRIPVPKEMRKWVHESMETVESDNIAEWAHKNGYDGVIIKNVVEPKHPKVADDYIVFKSSQIKKVNASPAERVDQESNGEAVSPIAESNKKVNSLHPQPKTIRAYHGTTAGTDFKGFSTEGPVTDEEGNPLSSGSGADPTAYLGAHFAAEPNVANKFATKSEQWMKSRFDQGEGEEPGLGKAGPRVIPVDLKFKKIKNFGPERNMRNVLYSGDLSHEGYAGDELLNIAMREDGIEAPDEGGEAVDKWLQQYQSDPNFRTKQNEWLFESYLPEEGEEEELLKEGAQGLATQTRNQLTDAGYDGASYNNQVEGGKSYVAFHPNTITSPFKAETPKIAHGAADEFLNAVQNTTGAKLDGKSLTVRAERYQKPEQAGEPSVRTGVFYSPEPKSPYSRHYKKGSFGYGGPQRVEGELTFKNPIVAKGGSGGKVPERAYDAIKGKGAYNDMRGDVLDAVQSSYRMGEGGRADASARLQKIADVLEKYGADPDNAEYIIEHSKEGNTLPYAVQENIVAHAVRAAGHDGIVGYNKIKGQHRLSEVFHITQDSYPEPEEKK